MEELYETFQLGSHEYDICVLKTPENRGLLLENCETAIDKNNEIIKEIDHYISLINSLNGEKLESEEIEKMFGFDSSFATIPIAPYLGGEVRTLMTPLQAIFGTNDQRRDALMDLEITKMDCEQALKSYTQWMELLKVMHGIYSKDGAMSLIRVNYSECLF